MSFIQAIKPKLSKRNLLFLAAFVWTFAGIMLLAKGMGFFCRTDTLLSLSVMFGAMGGILFYFLLFSKISLKHIHRITGLKSEKPCMFSFFGFRGYILMAIMITSGILLRKSGIILPEYLSILFITMGIPLFLSAIRFYYHAFSHP